MLDFSLEPYRQEMLENLKKFIRIRSVKGESQPNMPYGKGIFDALMYVQSTAESMDLDCVNMFGQMAYVDYGFGDKMLGVLVHVDVVPEGDGWSMPAFEGVEKDGKLYGRGAIDNKGPAIAALYALRALKDNCVQLNMKVRLLFGTDEETTWQDMEFYKQHGQIPDMAFSPDGEYPIINTEKGAVHFELSLSPEKSEDCGITIESFESGTRPNVVPNKAQCVIHAPFEIIQKSLSSYKCPTGAKFSCEKAGESGVLIKAEGVSSHGSKPEEGVNAAAALLAYLGILPLSGGALEKAVYALSEKIGADYNGEKLGLDITDESGRLTLNIGTVSIKDGKLKTSMDIRYPVSLSFDFIDSKLRENFSGFDLKYLHCLPSHHVPEDSPLVLALKETYTETTGQEAYCLSIGGATYARAFDNAVTFGPLFPGKPNTEHGPDEYIETEDLFKNAEIIANAIIKLCALRI